MLDIKYPPIIENSTDGKLICNSYKLILNEVKSSEIQQIEHEIPVTI